ncbi:MAG: CoA-binding protein [Saprospiraceae bacterium]|nr:MAG: putative CoA-binding protein [Bacteroidetes bacterium OLB9]MCO6463244.1 CoA-binding protein [Saprospiraceae bacterium]MCZ2338330.1 CoA-binding protein [Chitinophagales bacterium]
MNIKDHTLVIGASEKLDRYSNKAVKLLLRKGKKVYALGNRDGKIEDVNITKERLAYEDVHTITLYINPTIQKTYYDYILGLHPIRIIFNPGTENPELESMAKDRGILTEEACTLVLLNTGQY